MRRNEQSPLDLARDLKQRADALLVETGLLELLTHNGEVLPTGSYSYDLMTWRDIDLCLATKTIDIQTIFLLGHEIATLPGVGSMYYRNEFIMKTPGNPQAVFWCVDFYPPGDKRWKVDILISDPQEVARVLMPGRQLLGRLTEESREAIIRIKSVVCQRPAYRQEYNSSAIYRAVIEESIRTVEEWDLWWTNQRG